MAKKFIPNGDGDFEQMAGIFGRAIAKDPGRYGVGEADATELSQTVARYAAALQACRCGERSATKTRVKDEARAAAEAIIRRLAHVIRANPKVDAIAKFALGLRERTALGRAKLLTCPQEPPRLRFVRALHEGGGATPMHELEFRAIDRSKSRPAGAVRLELFVDLVPPEEPIPSHPGANLSSRPWYLRSYTRSPIRLVPPLAWVPMQVVYWGRWADSMGNVGPFSATVVGWMEGGCHRMLAPAIGKGNTPVPVQADVKLPGPEDRDRTYILAVVEAQVRGYLARDVVETPERPPLQLPEAEGVGEAA